MFQNLAQHRRILVTGPHRSGTTIAAEMIGHDTGMAVVREEAFGYRDIERAEALFQPGIVMQGPYLLPWVPILSGPRTLVVYMDRDHDAVMESRRRLGERGVSLPLFTPDQARRLWGEMGRLWAAMTLPYADLAGHPLWIGAEGRRGFGHRQTR